MDGRRRDSRCALVVVILGAALAFGRSAHAAPVEITGQLELDLGFAPPIVVPFADWVGDVTDGVLTIPSGVAYTAGAFLPVTGFPLDLVTGLVVTAAIFEGRLAIPAPPEGDAASILGGGFGGRMPIIGVMQLKGPLAINVPLVAVGVGGFQLGDDVLIEAAPWTTGVAKVTTTGTPMAMEAATGTRMGEIGAISSTVSLVTPVHINVAGVARLRAFPRLSFHVPDIDGDGVRNGLDNCRATPNPDQEDADEDDVGDACDNCPFAENSEQQDEGGIGRASAPDGIGDACQCGDVNGDGRVTVGDSVIIARAQLEPPTATLAQPALCDVDGDGECGTVDAVVLLRALLQPPTAVVGRTCGPAGS